MVNALLRRSWQVATGEKVPSWQVLLPSWQVSDVFRGNRSETLPRRVHPVALARSPSLGMLMTPHSKPILYDQRQRYSLDGTTQTNANVPPRAATASPALSGEAWLRRLEDMQATPAGVGESWLRDEEQGDSGHAATELLELLEPRQAENTIGLSPEPSQRERRLSSEWREAMSARARRRFHAQPQTASAKVPAGAKQQRGVTCPVPSAP